jgi:ubiquinone/menaquinone biosynthesis C-methylase UbiE
VLDVGCGAGDSLADLAEAYGSSIKLTGADFSSRAVEAASARLGGRANIVRADATRLPFHDELFSHVLVFGLLEHIRDDDRALAEVWRVCARGAHVFISTSNASSALQGINYVRHNTLGYPYGYQRNVRRADVVSDVKRLFRIEKLDIQHADADMPVIRTVDRIVGKLLPNWGATST